MTTDFNESNPNKLSSLSIDDIIIQDKDNKSVSGDSTSLSKKSDEIRQKVWERFDDCLDKKKQSQQKLSINETKIIVKPPIEKTVVKEFSPQNATDTILPILREIFVESFHQYYQEIENELKLKNNKNLREWLQEVFDGMQTEMLEKKCRCFMLCSSEDGHETHQNHGIIGFLTLEEKNDGSIYIAQCAIDAHSKQCGYGSRLIQHLRQIYPSGTYYWGLCRRANRPAVNFYVKLGAKFIDDKNAADKKGYDSSLYAGFEFKDTTGNGIPSNASATVIETIAQYRANVTYQDISTMTEPLLDKPKKQRSRKRLRCCVVT